MKKTAAILILLLIVCSFCSCTPVRVELKNRVIIEAIGIDKGEGDKISVTFQFLNTDQSSNPNNGSMSSEVVKVSTIDDVSVSSAINQLTETIGKVPMLSQNRVVIFGRELAQAGIEKYLDYYNRNAVDRATVLLAVADKTAQEIVEAKMGDGVIPAKEIENVLNSIDYNAKTYTQTLYGFIDALKTPTTSSALPIIGLKESDEEEKEAEMRSTAIFEQDKMICELEKEHTESLLWLEDKFKSGFYNVTVSEGKNVTLAIIKSKTKISAAQKDGNPFYTIQISCMADCVEVNHADSSVMNNADIKKIQTAAQSQIEQQIYATLSKCFVEMQIDPFEFGNRLWRAEPELYRTLSANWRDSLPKSGYEVHAKIEIRRIGEGYIQPDIDGKL